MYFDNEKVGHVYFDLYFDTDSKNKLVYEFNASFKIISNGSEISSKIQEKYYFDGKTGEIQGCETASLEMPSRTSSKTQVVKKGNNWLAIDNIGNTEPLSVSLENYGLKEFLSEDIWFLSSRKIGEKKSFQTFNCETLKIEQSSTEITGIRTSLIWGDKVGVYDIVSKDKELGEFPGVYLEDGRFWSANIDPFIMQLEPEELAKNQLFSGLNLDEAFRIEQPIDQYQRLEQLKLRVSGPSLSLLPNSYNQVSAKNKDGTYTVSLGQKANFKQKVSKGDYEEFLKSDNEYPLHHPRIVEIRDGLKDSAKSDDEIIWLLMAFVSNSLIDDYFSNSQNVLEILNNQKGDCTEHAKLFVTLARAAGFPAREVNGLVYNNDPDMSGFSAHAWAEVAIDGYWIGVDPSWGERTITPIHIKVDNIIDLIRIKKIEITEKNYTYTATKKENEPIKEAYQNRDYEKIFKRTKMLAEKGDARHQYIFGSLFADGKIIPKNELQAFSWLLKSALQGIAISQLRLGDMYFAGKSVRKSALLSSFWYERAASQGNYKAAYYLAEAYERGFGVPKSQYEAFHFYKLAGRAAFKKKNR